MPKSIVNYRLCFALLVAGFWLGTVPAGTPPSSSRVTPTVQAVAKIMPSVVSIGTTEYRRIADPWLSYFDAPPGYVPVIAEYIPLGSGVVVDASGLVLTNYHVVARANDIRVRLDSGQVCLAVQLAHDRVNDLCLLELQNLPAGTVLGAADFAVPGDLLLGETVIAVGNPFGYEHTVTKGILSAKNRVVSPDGKMRFTDILQTDAAINPGNSGGPLINLDGQLIGINVAIRQDAEGIGFAIPLERIEKILATWMVPARRTTSILGLVPETRVVDGVVQAVVGTVEPQTPAAEAGIQPGTGIEAVNGTVVHRAIEVSRLLFQVGAEDSLHLRLAGGRNITLKAKPMNSVQLVRRRLGLRVQALTPALREAMGIPRQLEALAISEIYPGSDLASWRNQYGDQVLRGDLVAGIRAGDNVPITQTDTVEGLAKLLANTRGGMELLVAIYAVENVNGQPFLSRGEVKISLQ